MFIKPDLPMRWHGSRRFLATALAAALAGLRFFALTITSLFFLAQLSLAAESAREKITFAYAAVSPSMAGVWMAKEIGAFEKYGLNAELVYISSGATAIQALVGASVQAALGASNAVVAATLKGAPMIAVASNTSRPGMQLWVQPEIQSAEQLQGKTLAITRFGSTSDFVTRLILRKLNLEGKTELRQFGGVVEADLGFRARQAGGPRVVASAGSAGENVSRRRGVGNSLLDESAGREQRLLGEIAEIRRGHRSSLHRRDRGIKNAQGAGAQVAGEIHGRARRQRGGTP